MISYFFLLIAIIFFVWGLITIIKGWHGCAEDDTAPFPDLEEIKEFTVADGATTGYPFERRRQENERKAEQLKAENQNLMRELKEKEDHLQQLRDDRDLTQKISDQKFNDAQRAMDLLRVRSEESARRQEIEATAGSAKQEALNKQLSETTAAVDQLRKEKEDGAAVKADLQERLQKAEAHNARLVERENTLRHELARQHAQILGLEKICEDFRIQLDEMAKSPIANG